MDNIPAIDLQQFTITTYHLAFTFASDLGWKPGQWPKAFQVAVKGEVRATATFVENEYHKGGDLEAVVYYSRADNMTYRIFND